MALVEGPKCLTCFVEKQPWGLREWKCPKCGAIGGNTLDDVVKRLEALERTVEALTRKQVA